MKKQEILKAAEKYCDTKTCKECGYWRTGRGCELNYPGTKGEKKHA